jgi:hypothetical protein
MKRFLPLLAFLPAMAFATVTPVPRVSPAVPASPEDVEPVTVIFAASCMAHYHDPEGMDKEMTGAGAEVLNGESSKKAFLDGHPGHLWLVKARGNPYVISLRDDGLCSVFAEKADVAKVQAAFSDMALLPERKKDDKVHVIRVSPEKAGPNSDTLKSIGYAWRGPGKTALFFSLTTSTSDKAPLQAMMSVATVNADASDF